MTSSKQSISRKRLAQKSKELASEGINVYDEKGRLVHSAEDKGDIAAKAKGMSARDFCNAMDQNMGMGPKDRGMIDYEQALDSAKKCLGKVEVCKEYKNYYVFGRDVDLELDGSENYVAVNKISGDNEVYFPPMLNLGPLVREFSV